MIEVHGRDAQQDIIKDLREQLSEARKTANELTDELTAHKEAVRMCEETLSGIADADWKTFWKGSTPQDFVDWARSRSRNTISAIAKLKEVGCE